MNPPPAEPASSGQRRAGPLWLRRSDLFVRVIVRLYIGLLLVVLPWTRIWNDNHLLEYLPYLSTIAFSGITRGVVSGLGLLNVWIAAVDALGYREG